MVTSGYRSCGTPFLTGSAPIQHFEGDEHETLRGRLPPLNTLRAFEAVGRTGSMRKAADDIGVSHPVVSRHIANLEAWIGRRLVEAGPRGVQLTPAGASLHAAVSQSFRSLADATMQLKAPSGGQSLRIWCMPGLATRWLAPRLGEIRRILPDVDINLRAVDPELMSASVDADLVIGFGDLSALPRNATPLLTPRMFPVASPEWLARNGRPQTLEQLAGASLIHEESYAQWTAWLAAAGLRIRRPLSGPRLGDASLGFDAALAGQGIALTTRLMVAQEIDTGRLEELFQTDIRLGGYYVAQLRSDDNGRISRFRDWLVSALRDAQA
ncbi:MAG TPA: LysR substrate-binding domain-containing protein [Devosiaceae bacterium]